LHLAIFSITSNWVKDNFIGVSIRCIGNLENYKDTYFNKFHHSIIYFEIDLNTRLSFETSNLVLVSSISVH